MDLYNHRRFFIHVNYWYAFDQMPNIYIDLRTVIVLSINILPVKN